MGRSSAGQAASRAIIARPIERVSVKGRSGGTLVYELLALRSDGRDTGDASELETLADLSTRAIAQYHDRDFAGAAELYERALTLRPDDPVTSLMLDTCRGHQASAPPDDWDGIRYMDNK